MILLCILCLWRPLLCSQLLASRPKVAVHFTFYNYYVRMMTTSRTHSKQPESGELPFPFQYRLPGAVAR